MTPDEEAGDLDPSDGDGKESYKDRQIAQLQELVAAYRLWYGELTRYQVNHWRRHGEKKP